MNAKRMTEYVQQYDVDLEASIVSLNHEQEVTGLCMIAFRDTRAWITRLGVVPERRLHKNGQFLMETVLETARQRGIQRVQLEVIQGNEPARNLFLKLGFQDVQELLIIRRPPGAPNPELTPFTATFNPIPHTDIPNYLSQRTERTTWLDENRSLLNTGGLKGFSTQLDSSEKGWAILQNTPFQLTHLVFSPNLSANAAQALLHYIHQQNPMQDAKIENLSTNSPYWHSYQKLGYFEVFRRTEMHLRLS